MVVGQGAEPGGGGMLLVINTSFILVEHPATPPRHDHWPRRSGNQDRGVREITDWQKPIYIKIGASRPTTSTALAVESRRRRDRADGMQGGTVLAQQDVFIEHVGLPILGAIQARGAGAPRSRHAPQGAARSSRRSQERRRRGQGADARRRCGSIGTAALIALGDNDPALAEYRKLGSHGGTHDHWYEGRDPAGITTQDPVLAARLEPGLAGGRLANYPRAHARDADHRARLRQEPRTHTLEPEDLRRARAWQAAAMARVPLAGTDLDSREEVQLDQALSGPSE